MSDEQRLRWDTFIDWARRFYERWPDFDKEERDYKLAIGRRLHEAREALRSGSPAWLPLLTDAVTDKDNNLLNWHVKGPFVAWCRARPEVVASVLTQLWEDASPIQQRVQRFADEVPDPPVRNQHGMFASFLLMALDPTTHPMYRNEAYRMAYRLTGFPDRPKHGSGAIYQHALDFLDRLLAEVHQRGLPLRDRLDAQGVLWCVTWYKPTDEPVSGWSEQERQAFLAFRAPAEESPSQPDTQLPTDPAAPAETVEADEMAWMFQFNPDHYHLEQHVQEHGPYDWWEAKQYRQHMHIGQRVYFMQSGGAGRAAIVAVGRIVSEVYPAPEDAGYAHWIDVWYEARVVPPIGRQYMREDPVLAGYHPYTTGLFSTNFLLPRTVAERTAELVEGRLQPFAISEQSEVSTEGFDPAASVVDARTRTITAVVRRQGQWEFRQRLLAAYGRQCAVTGCDAADALEAAHIAPYRGPHTNSVTNGLLLRADIHALFDLGLLAVDTNTMMVLLAPSLSGTTYAPLAGQFVRLPTNPALRPDTTALEEHRRQSRL